MPLGASCIRITLYDQAKRQLSVPSIRGITAALPVGGDRGKQALARRISEDSEHEHGERLVPPGHPAAGPHRLRAAVPLSRAHHPPVEAGAREPRAPCSTRVAGCASRPAPASGSPHRRSGCGQVVEDEPTTRCSWAVSCRWPAAPDWPQWTPPRSPVAAGTNSCAPNRRHPGAARHRRHRRSGAGGAAGHDERDRFAALQRAGRAGRCRRVGARHVQQGTSLHA
jgi:hypothetical protein